MKGAYILAFLLVIIFSGGCVKETYNLDVLSREAQLSPTFVLPAIKGKVTFGNLVKPGKSVAADPDGLVKIIFKKDSVVNLSRDDFYDAEGLLGYSHQFSLGNLKIDPFGGSVSATPAEITSPMLKKIFPAFTNFIKASFASGFADITIRNEMNHPVEGMILTFSTPSGQVRKPFSIPALQPGQEHAFPLSLSGIELGNIMTVAASGASIPGADESLMDVTGNVTISINARDPRISSGKAIIPLQAVSADDSLNYIDLTAGTDTELDQIKFTRGRLAWRAASPNLLAARLDLLFPAVIRSGMAVKETIVVNPAYQARGSIQLAGSIVNLASDPHQPFNRIPYTFDLAVSSNKTMVRFNSADLVNLEMQLLDFEPDYIKGYFGQQVHSITTQSLNTGIEEYAEKLSGNLKFTDPLVRLSYSNSFSIPMDVALEVQGKKNSEIINLGLDPFPVLYPVVPGNREVSSTYVIGKDNSQLPDLISLLPSEIHFSGAAKFNPKGEAGESRNNYIFGNSRFVASVEVEVPLSLKFDSIHLADTIPNFLAGEKLFELMSGSDSRTSGNIRIASLDLRIKNSFPFDVSFNMSLLGETKNGGLELKAGRVLKAAITDISGRVVSPSETLTTVKFEEEFLGQLNESDKIILDFFVNTGNNKEIRIFTDYEIEFSASVKVNTEFNFELP